ncbi:hypothetical protein [Nostoc sp. CHAB 5715]|uniref:hypothetical protein n=1 Tax=Nostoc sp. CHAB 5715 TaxID=2780400 RepID=UPI001E49CCCE|nr:hypothetical protein [Nostoc sp. CHAB 5715]MCC5622782.1 hypothetical protein [Nostoc sp. CHAB 5715]
MSTTSPYGLRGSLEKVLIYDDLLNARCYALPFRLALQIGFWSFLCQESLVGFKSDGKAIAKGERNKALGGSAIALPDKLDLCTYPCNKKALWTTQLLKPNISALLTTANQLYPVSTC